MCRKFDSFVAHHFLFPFSIKIIMAVLETEEDGVLPSTGTNQSGSRQERRKSPPVRGYGYLCKCVNLWWLIRNKVIFYTYNGWLHRRLKSYLPDQFNQYIVEGILDSLKWIKRQHIRWRYRFDSYKNDELYYVKRTW